MTRTNSVWTLLISMAIAAPLAACGGTTSGSGATSTPSASAPPATAAPTPTASTAAAQCPTGAAVGSTLGTTLPNAVGVGGGTSGQLPSGVTALICDYHTTAENVIIEILSNINPSYISNFSSHYPVAYKTVSGLGDQARSFYQSLNNGKDNEGVVASKGQTMVSIGATATPATLSQVEALVNSLL